MLRVCYSKGDILVVADSVCAVLKRGFMFTSHEFGLALFSFYSCLIESNLLQLSLVLKMNLKSDERSCC